MQKSSVFFSLNDAVCELTQLQAPPDPRMPSLSRRLLPLETVSQYRFTVFSLNTQPFGQVFISILKSPIVNVPMTYLNEFVVCCFWLLLLLMRSVVICWFGLFCESRYISLNVALFSLRLYTWFSPFRLDGKSRNKSHSNSSSTGSKWNESTKERKNETKTIKTRKRRKKHTKIKRDVR